MALLDEVETIAHWVRFHRKRNGWSQAKLADEAGVAQPRISELERGTGDPQVSTIAKVARALGLPLNALLVPVDDQALQQVG